MKVDGVTKGELRHELRQGGVVRIETVAGFRDALSPPRAIFIHVPAGRPVDTILDDLTPALEPGDVIVDGGNSYWGDSIRRHRRLRERELFFVDVGTSGGVEGARYGACFMVGGEREAVARIEPILRELAAAEG